MINAMCNHLRYPNIHTLFWHRTLIALFNFNNQPIYKKGSDLKEEIQEIILRVLVERMTAMRPHPWGLVFTYRTVIHKIQEYSEKNGDLPSFMKCRKVKELVMQPYNSWSARGHSRNWMGSGGWFCRINCSPNTFQISPLYEIDREKMHNISQHMG